MHEWMVLEGLQAIGEPMTGPPIKMDWEERGDKEKYLKEPEGQKLLWECSEVATGVKFLT